MDPEDVFPVGGIGGIGEPPDGREDAAIILGGSDEVEDPVGLTGSGHTAEGRGRRAAEGRL